MPHFVIKLSYYQGLTCSYRPEQWAGKRVLVVGFGNTAADIAGVLVNTAKKVYLSHRRGAIVVSEETMPPCLLW
jgi:cation diffusion facilitator CzcD-associated flavoprotein CzcO